MMTDNPFKKLFILSASLMLFTMAVLSFDYGITGDERDMKVYGEAVFNFFATFGEDKSYQDMTEVVQKQGAELLQYYGGLFDFLAAALNKISPFEEYNTRHLLNAIFGFIAMLFTGLLAKEIGGWRAGLIAIWLIFLSPRFFGHSMNNPKDIPFATAFIASIYFMILLVKQLPKPSWKTVIFLGLCIAASINIRVGGLLLFAYLGLFTIIEVFFKHPNKSRFFNSYNLKEQAPVLKYLLVAVVIGYFGGILLWPYGLQNPLTGPLESLSIMSDYSVNMRQLFEGNEVMSSELPGYYLPKMMAITNPLAVLLGVILILITIPFAIKQFNPRWMFMLLFAGVFPIAYIIYKDSNVYGGWRHVLFAYPSLVVLAALGWEAVIRFFEEKKVMQYVAAGALILLLLLPLRWTIASHPNQYVYFNELVGGIKGAYGYYETDYWMNAMKPALKWMKEEGLLNDPDANKILITSNAGILATYRPVYANDVVKIEYTRYYQRSEEPWDYGIWYSGYVNADQLRNKTWPPAGTLHTVEVDGVPLAAVIKRPSYKDLEGMQALNSQQYDQAIEAFKEYLKHDANNEMVLTNLGIAYYYKQQPEQAIQYLNRSIQVNPGNANALSVLGNIYMNAGKMDEAILVFDRLIEGNPGYAPAYLNIGVAYAQSGNIDLAISYLKKAIQINPGMKQGYEFLARLYQQKGDQQTAQRYLELSRQLQ